MASAQQLLEERADQKRNPALVFRVGEKVWLDLKNVQTPQPKKKLAWVNAKYKFTKIISPHVVELDVPSKLSPRFFAELIREILENLIGEDRAELEDVAALDRFEAKYGKGDELREDEGARRGQVRKKIPQQVVKRGVMLRAELDAGLSGLSYGPSLVN
ncbi:hypothetical protein K3495_g5021 [Podosphaera aphanis]|nr:hypothetical protein K3495_g5021 [Podosphaera aphanis]